MGTRVEIAANQTVYFILFRYDDEGIAVGSFLRDCVDSVYYLEQNPDVANAGLDPVLHFIKWGHQEGRVPNIDYQGLAPVLRARSQLSATPLTDIAALLPTSKRSELSSAEVLKRLRNTIHPAFYAAQIDDGIERDADATLVHFLSIGVFAGLRVSLLFNPGWYEEVLSRLPASDGCDWKIEPGVSPFFHWLTIGWDHEIVPTPLFDADFYLAKHADLARWKEWSFLHFLKHGAFEANRRPSPHANRFKAAAEDLKAARRPLLLDAVVACQTDSASHDLRVSSPLEDAIAHLVRKTRALESDAYRELIAKAAAIEPLILRPYGPKDVRSPPFKHALADLLQSAESFRRDIGVDQVDTIVLVPHCRMAGSARVAGELTRAIDELRPGERTLVLTTDLAEFEYPEWFAPTTRVFDLSRYAEGLVAEDRIRLLLDAVRGLGPARVINVNSRLGWELFRTFGKQLSSIMQLHAYLFTWDLDRHGNKGGYPIEFFQSCFPVLSGVLIDNAGLRDELVDRYALSTPLQERLHVLHTPAEPNDVDFSRVFENRRSAARPLRAFWAGRFDRQKRFDIVVRIAERMPELEIWAWGKPVLGQTDVDFDALPPNIQLQGTYRNFDDLPLDACDFFLYTSQWDGLPTVLIDAGIRGMATVASRVGGIADLVTEDTGFPVAQPLEVDAYLQAIRTMQEDPGSVTCRAARFKARTERMCNKQAYVRDLAAALGLHEIQRRDQDQPSPRDASI